MANTITKVKQGVPGDLRYVFLDIDITTYTAGGIPLGAEEMGLSKLLGFFAQATENPYVIVHDNKDGRYTANLVLDGEAEAGTLTVVVDGKTLTITTTAHDDAEAPETLATVAAKIAAAILADGDLGKKFTAVAAGETVTVKSINHSANHTFVFTDVDSGITVNTLTKVFPIMTAHKIGGSIAAFTPAGTIAAYTPAGTVDEATHVFTGTEATLTFTGTADTLTFNGAFAVATTGADIGVIKVMAYGYP